jgi:nucleotide-binding universal stress UspA family protein
MTASEATTASASGRGAAPFADVLCAVDGSRGGAEAARQAIALARPDGAVCFLAITHVAGSGLAAMAELGEGRGRETLDQAALLARQAGVGASTELRPDGSVADLLLAESRSHDLLAVGSHGGSRAGGIMLGSTASHAAHRCERPVLIARRRTDAPEFPQRVLLASNGSPGSWAALWTTLRIARARFAEVLVCHVPDGLHPEWTRQIDRQLDALEEATGLQPSRVDEPGNVPERILEAAASANASLIVMGRRGLSGLRALGSVSERVAHRALCSVLLVPPDEVGS